jgi:hypothetical protein
MTLQKIRQQVGAVQGKLAEHHAWQRWLSRKLLPLTQSLGFSVIGDHFYEPVPNLKYIEAHYSDEPRDLPGFHAAPSWAPAAEAILGPYLEEYLAGPAFKKYGRKNWFYTGWDAAYYYCLIRSQKPKAITEVGRGISTWIAGVALDRNAAEGHHGEIVSIDPYFRGDNSTARTRIITAELQRIPAAERDALLGADIFFVDSSHVAKWGSDVLRLFESWIPNVAVNTLVHVHDIFTPYDYPRQWLLEQKRFWNEQYIFESFMAFNADFQIECPIFYLARTGILKQIAEHCHAPALDAASGAAIWLKRIQ